MTEFRLDDPGYVREQYRDAANLDARRGLHATFGTNPQPWPEWLWERMDVSARDRVLEVGCGTGALWRSAPVSPALVVVSDLSKGMVEKAADAGAGRLASLVTDVVRLPFGDATFDVVMAHHMLYHAPDLPGAIAEIARVLVPGGRLFAGLNGPAHLRQLHELVVAVCGERGSSGWQRIGIHDAADHLEPLFEVTGSEVRDNPLHITSADAVVTYLRSHPQPIDDDGFAKIHTQVARTIAGRGALVVDTAAGLVSARKR